MTTAAHTTPRALTAYLTRATWGLPEARRQELWDELEEHILTRADHLILSGLTPTQATAQAIRELGPPARVTLGMAKVYTMPKLILTAATLALGISAGLYALAGGGEQLNTVPVILRSTDKPTCVRGTVPQGVNVISRNGAVTCYFYETSPARQSVFLAGSELVRTVQAQGGQATLRGAQLTLTPPGVKGVKLNANARFVQDGQSYFDAWMLISLVRSPLEMKLSGFARPEIHIGKLSIQLAASESVGEVWYGPLSPLFVRALGGPLTTADASVGHIVHGTGTSRHVNTRLPAGEVVMLLTRRPGNNYTADTAEVQSDGSVDLHAEASNIRFVSALSDLTPPKSAGPRTALLVRVTNVPLNNLKSGIFVPDQATSDAR